MLSRGIQSSSSAELSLSSLHSPALESRESSRGSRNGTEARYGSGVAKVNALIEGTAHVRLLRVHTIHSAVAGGSESSTRAHPVRHCVSVQLYSTSSIMRRDMLDVEVDLPPPPRNSNNLRCLIVCVINVSLSDSHCKEHTMLASAPAGNIASPLPSPR